MAARRGSAGVGSGARRRASAEASRARTFLGAVAAVPFPGRVVTLGDADAVVLAVQRRLNRVGCGPIDEDGVFGPQTAAAAI